MTHLWGRITSINVRKVVWAAQELGLDLPRTDAGGIFGLNQDAEYLRRNPNGLVPMLEDDDGALVLWESNVIVRYLCARYPRNGLYPESLTARFQAEMWMDWQQTTLNKAGRMAFLQLIRTPAAERDPAVIAQSVAETEPLLAMLDKHLATHEYMLGDHFTMADIPIACEAHRWFNLPQPRATWPHLERWYESMRTRPAAVGVLDQTLS